jgi:hypothetical protein
MTQAGGKPVAPTIAFGLPLSTAVGNRNWAALGIKERSEIRDLFTLDQRLLHQRQQIRTGLSE